jgi:SAM-dependent methyltransferase
MLSWTEAPCAWCGTHDSWLLFEGEDLLIGMPGKFKLVECKKCGLIRQNPRLEWESLKAYYPEDYSPYRIIIDQEQSTLRRVDRRYGMWKRLQALEKYQPGGKLLDVGCGTGIFLGEAQRSGHWEVMGVEPSPQASAYASQALGIPILTQRFAETDLPDNSTDVVSMWDVLEHLDDPIRDLKRAHQMLRPGGWLVLGLPNVDGIGAKLFGNYWVGWDLPRHLYLFPQKVLRSILEEIGFEWKTTRCIAGAHSALKMSFEFLLRAKKYDNKAFGWIIRVYKSIPVRVLLSPLFYLSDRFHQSTQITIFARKR